MGAGLGASWCTCSGGSLRDINGGGLVSGNGGRGGRMSAMRGGGGSLSDMRGGGDCVYMCDWVGMWWYCGDGGCGLFLWHVRTWGWVEM